MRFKLATGNGQAGDRLAQGIGSLVNAVAMAPIVRAQAAEEAQSAEQKRELMGAQTNQALANTRYIGAKADQEADITSRRSLAEQIRDAALTHGVAPHQLGEFERFAQTGQMPAQYQPPPVDGVGPHLPAPNFYQDDVASKIWKTLGLNKSTLAFDRGTVNDVANATGAYRDQGLGDAVLAGTLDPGRLAEAQAAAGGKARFSAIGDSGAGFNQFTGAEQVLNPGMAVLFGNKTRQGIATDRAREGASIAQAGASNASAANSYASAAKTRQDIAHGGSTGQVQVVPGADGSVMLVDKRTGQARPALGPDGRPVQGKGPPVRALPASAAKGHLENLTNLRRAETALGLVQGKGVGEQQGDPEATGWKGFLPNTLLNRMDPKGVATRAAIADLGSLVIHDRSGAAVTAAEFPRLAPFIPSAYDDAQTVAKKLQMFVTNYRAIVDDAAEFYRQSGYTVPGGAVGGQAAAPPAGGPRPGAIQDGYRFVGGDPSQPGNWEKLP